MRVDTQTTIFDQVPPISAQVNINLQQEGSHFEVVHVASNASQTSVLGPSATDDEMVKHHKAVQEFTSNDKDYMVIAK